MSRENIGLVLRHLKICQVKSYVFPVFMRILENKTIHKRVTPSLLTLPGTGAFRHDQGYLKPEMISTNVLIDDSGCVEDKLAHATDPLPIFLCVSFLKYLPDYSITCDT